MQLVPGVTGLSSGNAPAQATRFPERRVVGLLFALIVTMMLTLSGSVLWDLGLNYSGVTGAVASKIHPASYLAFVTLGLLVIARRNPASFFVSLLTHRAGTLVFLAATALLGLVIVLDERKGIATVFDTYLLAIALSLIVAELNGRQLGRVEGIIHLLLAANALLALVEYAMDYRVFPNRYEGVEFDWDRRSTGLLGHPLEAAQMTGSYLMVLIAGGGPSMPKLLRLPAILLQLSALVPFGGRTALVTALALMTLWLGSRMVGLMRGRRFSVPAAAATAALVPILGLIVGVFASGGFFNIVLDRFTSDGGSASTRVEMFEVFEYLSWHDILMGASPDYIDSIRRTHGLEWGVENPIVRLLLYQGAAITAFLIAGFVMFLLDIARRLRPGAAMPFIFFLVVVNSYESISNKSIMLGLFVVLLMVMFRPLEEGPQPARGAQSS